MIKTILVAGAIAVASLVMTETASADHNCYRGYGSGYGYGAPVGVYSSGHYGYPSRRHYRANRGPGYGSFYGAPYRSYYGRGYGYGMPYYGRGTSIGVGRGGVGLYFGF